MSSPRSVIQYIIGRLQETVNVTWATSLHPPLAASSFRCRERSPLLPTKVTADKAAFSHQQTLRTRQLSVATYTHTKIRDSKLRDSNNTSLEASLPCRQTSNRVSTLTVASGPREEPRRLRTSSSTVPQHPKDTLLHLNSHQETKRQQDDPGYWDTT